MTARCPILTPEGITISFAVATAGDRLVAFLVDLLVIALIGTGLMLAFSVTLLTQSSIGAGLVMVALFGLRNFYFIYSELRWSGVTWGKRLMRLRVIARDGGPLTSDMIVARNLMRELELFLPLSVLIVPEMIVPEQAGWAGRAGLVWFFMFALLPLFGRYRLRCGDLIAGTIVVGEPTAALLPEIAAERGSGYAFTTAQLDVYGIHELHTLENVFRRHGVGRAPPELLDAIADRIRAKIGWSSPGPVESESFLRAFYEAQRAELERKLAFGTRKERKSVAN